MVLGDVWDWFCDSYIGVAMGYERMILPHECFMCMEDIYELENNPPCFAIRFSGSFN